MIFIDLPKYFPIELYQRSIDSMISRLRKEDGILSIYQIGHISTPGISDIDLVAVFADSARCRTDPRAALSSEDHYLFMHDLYGVCLTDFTDGQKYSFFHNYNHLWGEKGRRGVHELSNEDEITLKRQIALEYLVKMYISMTVEKTYGIVKLRSLFLQVKGLLYDCEFLGITSGPLYDAVRTLIARREAWFDTRPSLEDIALKFYALYDELTRFLSNVMCKAALCLPQRQAYHISRNICLIPADHFDSNHRGFTLPTILAKLGGRKYFNFQNRFNRFEFKLPLVSETIPTIITTQFAWQSRMKETNHNSFPHFMPLSSSLHLL
jgi:hypothetical protein